MAIIETHGLSKSFAGYKAVDNVSIAIEAGAIHAIIGPNGAGKTTFFNLLSGFLTPTAGRILVKGRDITGLDAPQVARLGVVRSFQINSIFTHLTVLDNVKVSLESKTDLPGRFWLSSAATKRLEPRAIELLAAVGLENEKDLLAVQLAYGRKRALELAISLAQDPEILLLDEPTAGMSTADVGRITELIGAVAKGRTVVLVEHNLKVVAELAQRITVLQRGKVLVEGSYDEVRGDRRVIDAYLGGVLQRMLETRNLNAYYDESHVLRGVDLNVQRGEVVTLVGRNGAGKTTTLKSIMGIVRRRSGDILFEGQPIVKLTSDKIARRGIGFVPEERGIYASLTVEENLLLPPVIGDDAWPLERIYGLFPILEERAKGLGTTLSGGEQQMLAIARVLRSGARLILLDEPTEGLAPVIVSAIGDLIREIKQSGVTILLVEQNMRFATSVADRHYLMVHGRIVESMSNADAIAREQDLLAHLGV